MAQAGQKARIARYGFMVAALLAMAGCKPQPQPFDPRAQVPTYGAQPPSYSGVQQPLPPIENPSAEGFISPNARSVKVALLVPLSGRTAELGSALRDAGILALFDKYAVLPPQAANVRVELVPKDTKGTAEGARQAAADAVNEGAELIIGPLFAAEVEAIKPLAKTGKISILSFSNNAQVAGDGVFVMGFDPAEQARRVAQYTYMQDKNRIAVLAPADEYGRTVTAAAKKAAELLGRKVEPVVNYSPNAVSVDDKAAELIEKGNLGGKLSFDALFLPESGAKLEPILSRLAQVNVTPQTVQFIGTGLWDDSALIRKHNLDGAWLASAPPALYSGFEQRFMNTYDYKPPRIASLAYDAVALAATLATSQDGFSREAITHASGYSAPANGIFRFLPSGKVERGLAVLRVRGGQFEVLDSAPVSFVGGH